MKIYPKIKDFPLTNKEAFDYLNKKNENLELLKDELNLDIDG